MPRRRPISILLLALLFVQAVLAGWSHSHCHHHAAAIAEHSHADGHTHRAHEREKLPPPQIPTDKDDCTLCHHLAQSSLLTIDSELASAGQITVPVINLDDTLVSLDAVGLRRPRSPPALG